ncbi:MAG: fibronectin type III domain-containing protein [Candidatus Nitrosotenuis sp.]
MDLSIMRLSLLLGVILIFGTMQNFASAATAPDPPANPSAVAVSPTQINLFWSAPAYDGGAAIASYKIDYKIGSGSYTNLVQSTTNTTYSHTTLTTGQSYTYKIYAINSAGTSIASSEVSATPTSSSTGTYPGAPTGLIATAVSPTQVNLYWNVPSNNGGYPISGYKIEFRVGSGSYSTLVSNTASTATSYFHQGLTTNQVYIYRVYAITSFGTSQEASAEALAQPTSSSSATAPGAPTNLSATAVSPTQVNLIWNAPSNIGSSPITGYKIEVKLGSGSYSTLTSNTGTTSTTYQHTGLATGTTYTYKVSAVNSAGAGSTSPEASATPISSSAPAVPGAPTNLVATVSTNQINLSWSAPTSTGGYPVTGYKIEYKVGSGSYIVLIQNTASASTTYSHTGITSGQAYVYRVYAINSIGTSAASSEATASSSSSGISVPGAPASFIATSAGPTQINLSWSPPSNTGGAAITGYKIEVKKGAGSYETLISNTQSTSTSFSHTGLTTGTTYYYRVYAINSVGIGPASDSSATPKETTSPALTATAVSPTSIILSWVPPSQTYKQNIVGYRIEEKIGQDDFRTLVDNSNSPSTTYTMTGLTTGKTYTYVVSALFTLGASPTSNEASATPLTTSTAPPPSQPTANPPSAPTGLSATAASATSINLSWNAPSNNGGSPVVGYKIEVKNGTTYQTLVSSTQNATTKYTHTNLKTDVTYYYRVYAINSAGLSVASAEASATPKATSTPPPPTSKPPAAPIGLVVKLVTSTQANLSWSPPSDDVTNYKIEYKIGSDPYRTLVSKTTDTTYSHTGLLANTYSYRVYAVNSAGASPPSNEVSIDNSPQQVEEPEPEESQCGPGTILKDGVCVVDAKPEPEPKPTSRYMQTHIPGFPDPKREPQYYINRYTSDSAFREWFDANFPHQTIYKIVGVAEPEPEPEPEPKPKKSQCGPGTHLENGMCVLDKEQKKGLLGGGCLVATATYGTELAPQVQHLREIRQNTLLATDAGTVFLSGFNDVYYVFSPTVADWERQNPAFRELVKISITPMLSSLLLLNYAHVDSEYEMLGYGIGIILLNVGMYFVTPAIIIIKLRQKL